MKKLLFIIAIILSAILLYFFRYQISDLFVGEKDQLRIGKTLWLDVKPGMLVDYAYINEYDLWDERERKKVVKYMKENDLIIKEGHYVFNQATTYEKALETFIFEKLD